MLNAFPRNSSCCLPISTLLRAWDSAVKQCMWLCLDDKRYLKDNTDASCNVCSRMTATDYSLLTSSTPQYITMCNRFLADPSGRERIKMQPDSWQCLIDIWLRGRIIGGKLAWGTPLALFKLVAYFFWGKSIINQLTLEITKQYRDNILTLNGVAL